MNIIIFLVLILTQSSSALYFSLKSIGSPNLITLNTGLQMQLPLTVDNLLKLCAAR